MRTGKVISIGILSMMLLGVMVPVKTVADHSSEVRESVKLIEEDELDSDQLIDDEVKLHDGADLINQASEDSIESVAPYYDFVDQNTGIGYSSGGYVSAEDSGMSMTYMSSYKITSFTPGKVTDINLPTYANAMALADIDEMVFANKGITSVSGGSLMRRYRRAIFMNNEITSVQILGANVLRIESDAFSGNQIKNLSFGKTLDSIDINAFRNQKFSKEFSPSETISLQSLFSDNQVVQTAMSTGGGNSAIAVSNISSSHVTYNASTGIFTRGSRREPFTFNFALTTIIDGNRINYSGVYSVDYDMDETAFEIKKHYIEIPQYTNLDLYENISFVTDKYGNVVDKHEHVYLSSDEVDTSRPGSWDIRYYYENLVRDVVVNVLAVYDLSFETNGGSEILPQQAVVNSHWAKPAPPTKANFQFDGWYIDRECTEPFDFSQPATESRTIYAKWLENYTVNIPMRISLNSQTEVAISGINRGNEDLSVRINKNETSISDDNQLILKHKSDSSIESLSQLSWNGSTSDPDSPVLFIPSGNGVVQEAGVISLKEPKQIQAGSYEGRIVFKISYE
ncbi:InlB B-repeat-containing protein [Enterococcus malodoratus]|uniref:WxL domain-containing protein n=1 Tax=Enterococcus malodoratus ATCC 43197 TaxID=1158601 RepID=R2P462_9ENTE|nr:InlB B-repeat-containing protein [Enterococcus malodoratus]EOH79062.1 hypothetical protein UAI_01708 [Enterococcus malodoratus ATCC 43197]EOT64513.1 hypothetical protein I585_03713 [Enterococcus malodoratus ATCC 43197]OJG59587.1 hypothetical protein RV07_GL002601 [Enterococcus malodoratus]SPW92736.1 repeat [Enterococcus malodoratus]STC72834.1 repeat [Enterococcus malodoratus]